MVEIEPDGDVVLINRQISVAKLGIFVLEPALQVLVIIN
jgi:hypothetical protein